MTTTLLAGWKPISSAPKDGTPVLLFARHVDATASTRVVGSFDNNGFGWIAQCYVGQPFARLVPSHWMDLPAFPDAPTPPATTQDEPITVSLDPDPRGVSVGVWQGSHCIYTGAHAVPASAQHDAKDEQPQKNGCGSVSFELSDGSTVSCDWSANEWELSIPAKRQDRDVAFKELLQEIGRLRVASAAPAAGDARDAARYRWLRDHACNSLHLTRDGDHACNYLSAAEWIDSCPEDFQDDTPEEIARMKAANTIWRLQVYPNTPIGFWALHGSTLDAVVDASIAASQQQEG